MIEIAEIIDSPLCWFDCLHPLFLNSCRRSSATHSSLLKQIKPIFKLNSVFLYLLVTFAVLGEGVYQH